MILRVYLLSCFFRIILAVYIDSKKITKSKIENVLQNDEQIKANSDSGNFVDLAQSSDKQLVEERGKNRIFSFFFHNSCPKTLR